MMGCISPESIKAKNSKKWITIPCGKCHECLKAKRSEWSFRLEQELKTSISAWFITLTYNDENIPYTESLKHTLYKKDLQLFHKRLRQRYSRWLTQLSKDGNKLLEDFKTAKVRYYAVGEYGTDTKRPHYHGIYFNIPKNITDEIVDIWGKGQIKIGTVTSASIHYVTKYLITTDQDIEEVEKCFSLMSKKPAIGYTYLKKNPNYHTIENPYVINNGYKQKMPKFFKDRIYDDMDKRHIARISQSEYDKRQTKKYDAIEKRGENPYINELENKKQSIERFNKLIKKGRTL